MTHQQLQHIHEIVLGTIGVEYNLLSIKESVKDFDYKNDYSPEIVADCLIQSGQPLGLMYMRNYLSLDEVQQLIHSIEFPIVLFKRNAIGEFQAVVIDRHLMTKKKWIVSEHDIKMQELTEDFIPDPLENGDFLVVSCLPTQDVFSNKSQLYGEKKETTEITPFSRFIKLILSERKEISYLYIYAIIAGLIGLTLPLGIQSIIGFVSSGQISTSVIVLIFFIILGLILSGGLQIMQLYMVEYIQMRLFAKTAFDFAFRFPKIKTEVLMKEYPPELINRFFDVVSLQKSFSKILLDFSSSFLQVVFGLILLSLYHPYFILLGGILIAILYFIIRLTGPKALEYSLKESKYKYQTAHWLEEVARAISTFKLAGFSNIPLERTDSFVTNYLQSRKNHFRILLVQYWAFVAFRVLITGGLLILGSVLLINQEINLGQFVASEIIIILILNAVEKVVSQLDVVYDMLTSVEKIGQISDMPIEYHSGINADLIIHKNKGLDIHVKDLSFQYPNARTPVLTKVSFDIKAGEKVALTGFNNSGKSTLLNLMLGYYTTYTGVIAVQGLSMKNFNHNTLIKHIGDNISQEDIFESSLLDNITLGRKDISIEKVQEVIDYVGLRNYVFELPQGLYTVLKREMNRMPNIILQKLVLARCLVSSPSLLLIEDNFEGMKKDEKESLLKRLMRPESPWTLILVTDDVDIMAQLNRVIVLDGGKVKHDAPYVQIKNELNA